MKWITVPATVAIFCCGGAVPAAGHDCYHHDHDSADCDRQHYQANRPSESGLSSAPANLQTLEGRIVEVVYLPGAAADSGMVEITVQSASPATLVRLAPSGFLKRGGVLLQEGDNVMVKGFPVAGMEGDLIVAAEIQVRDKRLALRDTRGRPGMVTIQWCRTCSRQSICCAISPHAKSTAVRTNSVHPRFLSCSFS